MPRGRRKKDPDDIVLDNTSILPNKPTSSSSEVSTLKLGEIVDKPMKTILYENYNSYSSYIASGRTTVYVFDGMKTVTRRVLYSAFKNCRRENIKVDDYV